jgi:16S rRNA (uracil1498-N3)-methyltransferase
MAGYKTFLRPSSIIEGNKIILDRDESHHLCRVLRLKANDPVQALDGRGGVYWSKIVSADIKRTELWVEKQERLNEPKKRINLIISVPKQKAMDQILKACVEIGIQKIQPVFSEHSAFIFDAKQSKEKLDKWNSAIIESCKQSGCFFAPEIAPICKLEDYLKQPETALDNLSLVASLQEGSASIHEVIQGNLIKQTEVHLAVGPEGDFSEREYLAFKDKGFHAVRLGKNVLRSDTAVTYSLSVVDQMFCFSNC